MESAPDNVNQVMAEGQESLPNQEAEKRLQYNELLASSPLRETSGDISKTHSDPGVPSQDARLTINPTVILEDFRRPRVGGRELQNLASVNAPGLMEDLS